MGAAEIEATIEERRPVKIPGTFCLGIMGKAFDAYLMPDGSLSFGPEAYDWVRSLAEPESKGVE